jgi:hypothetical protein
MAVKPLFNQLPHSLVTMHIFKVWPLWPIVSLSAAALLTPLLVAAQQPQPPSDAPPKLEMLQEGEPPSIKIGKPEGEHKITETRGDGQVKEIKVESGISTYYLKPNEQVGNALPGDTQSTTNRGAQWKVMEFDLGGKTKNSDGTNPATPSDGSAPATPPQK